MVPAILTIIIIRYVPVSMILLFVTQKPSTVRKTNKQQWYITRLNPTLMIQAGRLFCTAPTDYYYYKYYVLLLLSCLYFYRLQGRSSENIKDLPPTLQRLIAPLATTLYMSVDYPTGAGQRVCTMIRRQHRSAVLSHIGVKKKACLDLHNPLSSLYLAQQRTTQGSSFPFLILALS